MFFIRQNELLREQVKRGETGFPFQIYSAYPITSDHWHDEIELIYIIKGEMLININSIEYCGKAGDIFAVNKNEMHAIYCKTEETEYCAIVFDLSMLFFSEEDISQKRFITPLSSGKLKIVNKLEPSRSMSEIFKRILKLNSAKTSGHMLATKAALLEFFSIIITTEQYYKVQEELKPDLKSELLKNIVIYIENHLDTRIALEEISREFNMAPKYFCRFFKKNFRKTLIEYINDMRIERAIFMLGDNNSNITEIALSCGFSNASYFTRIFKKVTGYTPSKYFSD